MVLLALPLRPAAVAHLGSASNNGSERGPVALPVFKTGCSLLTRGGWVRLPGASANLRSRWPTRR